MAKSKTQSQVDAVVSAVNAKAFEYPLEARVIQYISNFPAPSTGQDTVDTLAAEFMTSALLRSNAEKRYEKIKQTIEEEFPQQAMVVRRDAANKKTKCTELLIGNDWQLLFAANKPSTRVDVDELRTALIKRGVKVTVIDECITEVEKQSRPAMIITAKPVV